MHVRLITYSCPLIIFFSLAYLVSVTSTTSSNSLKSKNKLGKWEGYSFFVSAWSSPFIIPLWFSLFPPFFLTCRFWCGRDLDGNHQKQRQWKIIHSTRHLYSKQSCISIWPPNKGINFQTHHFSCLVFF